MADALTGESSVPPLTNVITESGHLIQDVVNGRHDVDSVHLHPDTSGGPQRGMQGGTVLGHVDPLTPEHGVSQWTYAPLSAECDEQIDSDVGDRLL
jgi:hypothetical protein